MVIYGEEGSSDPGSPGSQEEQEETKDTLSPAFCELLESLENYQPTVPDALTLSYLNQGGFENNIDPQIVRLISVSAQKFISDIANDALVHCKSRTSNALQNKDKKLNKDRKYTLAVEDLTPALADHGICVRKPQYFV